MFVIAHLLAIVAGFLRCPITPVKTGPVAPAAIEYDGALPNISGLTTLFNALSQNASPVFGNWALGVYSGVTNTLAARDIVGGFIRRNSAQSNADLTDTATNIVNAIPGAVVGQSWPLIIANYGLGTMSPAAGTGVSFVGTSTIQPTSIKVYIGQVLGSSTVSLTSCFAFPTLSVL